MELSKVLFGGEILLSFNLFTFILRYELFRGELELKTNEEKGEEKHSKGEKENEGGERAPSLFIEGRGRGSQTIRTTKVNKDYFMFRV